MAVSIMLISACEVAHFIRIPNTMSFFGSIQDSSIKAITFKVTVTDDVTSGSLDYRNGPQDTWNDGWITNMEYIGDKLFLVGPKLSIFDYTTGSPVHTTSDYSSVNFDLMFCYDASTCIAADSKVGLSSLYELKKSGFLGGKMDTVSIQSVNNPDTTTILALKGLPMLMKFVDIHESAAYIFDGVSYQMVYTLNFNSPTSGASKVGYHYSMTSFAVSLCKLG